MAGSSIMRIDNVLEFLNRLTIDADLFAEALWLKHNAQTELKLLKTFICYTAKWSEEEKSAYLSSTEVEDNLYELEGCLSGQFSDPDYEFNDMTKIEDALVSCYSILTTFESRVQNNYEILSQVSHFPMSDPLVFDEFVASVKEYLASIPFEFESYILLASPPEWVPSSSRLVEEYHKNTADKLESFKYFICNFAKRCIDEEKVQYFLARAGAVVLSIAYLACMNYNLIQRELILYASSDLPQKLSPRNPDVTEIYHGVLTSYVETLKAAKPSGPVSSRTVEDLVNSFLTFFLSAKNQVDILVDVLDSSLLDLVKVDDYPKEEELFWKGEIAAVVREAGSLEYLISVNEMPNVKAVWETNLMLPKFLDKIKLIKAEIFLLELHKQKASLMLHVEDRVAAVREVTGFLCKFSKRTEGCIEDSEKLMITLIEAVVREVRSLCNSYHAKEITEDVILESSLAIFKLFKAEARLMVVIDNNASLKFLEKYRIESFHKCFIFLRALLSNPLKENLEDGNFSTLIEAMASEAALLVCSFGDTKMEMDQAMEMKVLLSQLPRMIELNNAEIKVIHQQGPRWLFPTFPKSDGFEFIDFLLGKLRELLTYKPGTIAFVKEQVEVLLQKLQFLISFFKDVTEQLNESKDLGTRVFCLVYEAEYMVELFVAGDIPLWYHQLELNNLIEEVKLIEPQVLQHFHGKKICDFAVQNVEPASRHMTLEASNPGLDEVIVGFDYEEKTIIGELNRGSQQLQVVSLVGMPGLGKTTLAKKIYNNRSIEYYFILRAWCYVSQVYQKRELLLDLLSNFVDLTDDIKKMDEVELAPILCQNLRGKRYLIVMDDVWHIEVWMDLKRSFPDDNNGSRILFTTRLDDVALQANPTRKLLPLPFLSEEESWVLLQNKLFPGGSCPEQLLEVGRKIAKNCEGLRLAIVVVAGLLKRTEKKKDRWMEVAESLRSRIADDGEGHFMAILEYSYNHLPAYLKPCFLYFGAFWKGQEILVQKLKCLWIAEGFIPKSDLKSVEETAEDYLVDLLGRSLVMEAKKRSNGGPKACQMHDMLRDLCLDKAREQNFMQLISTHDRGNSKSFHPSDLVASRHYRLCVHSSKEDFIQSIPFGPHVHSLLFFATSNADHSGSNDIPFPFRRFKLLRVLDLECITLGESFPSEIEFMFRLRYLAIRAKINSVPSSITKLWSLETLIVKGMKGEVVLPYTIWSMARLRHIQVNKRAKFMFPLQGHELESPVVLHNLATLSSPVISSGKEIDKLMRRLLGLRKLRCIFQDYWDDSRKCYMFPTMDFLTQLESLKIFNYGRISFPCEFSFPLNLKKLTLSKFRLPWKHISAIRRLPNLEVLKLLCQAFEGGTWDMTVEEFPNLKFLKFDNLNLANWNATSNNFPNLQRLVLQNCKKLEKVPSGFGEIDTLQMIELHWCSQDAANSMKIIWEQQVDFGNEEFKVLINPPEWDFRKSS